MIDALAGVRLNQSSPVPLYHQAAQALEAAIVQALDAITDSDARGYLAHCGYGTTTGPAQ